MPFTAHTMSLPLSLLTWGIGLQKSVLQLLKRCVLLFVSVQEMTIASTHTHMHTHMYIHTHIHIHICTHMHACI